MRKSPSAAIEKYESLIGRRFGRAVVVSTFRRTMPNGRGRQAASIRCDCGTEKDVLVSNIENGSVVSCGCKNSEFLQSGKLTHGKSRVGRKYPEYDILKGMIRRCTNPKCKAFQNYGGRGITVCPEWMGPFGIEQFLKDMGRRPSADMSIDRIDNDKGYSKDNCRWATSIEQNNNRRPARSNRWTKRKEYENVA